jgi:hypothetical protein
MIAITKRENSFTRNNANGAFPNRTPIYHPSSVLSNNNIPTIKQKENDFLTSQNLVNTKNSRNKNTQNKGLRNEKLKFFSASSWGKRIVFNVSRFISVAITTSFLFYDNRCLFLDDLP